MDPDTLLNLIILSNDPSQVQNVQGDLINAINTQESIFNLVILFQQINEDKLRNYIIIYLDKAINNNNDKLDAEQRKQISFKLLEFVNTIQLSDELLQKISNCFYNLNLKNEGILLEAFNATNNRKFILFLFSSSIDELSDEFIKNNYGLILEIGNWGIVNVIPEYLADVSRLFTALLFDGLEDKTIFKDAVSVILNLFDNVDSLNDVSYYWYWNLFDAFYSSEILPLEILPKVLEKIENSPKGSKSLLALEKIPYMISDEYLMMFINTNIKIIINLVAVEKSFPIDLFENINTVITQRNMIDQIKQIFFTLIQSENEDQLIVGIGLLNPILSSQNSVNEEEKSIIMNLLVKALQSENTHILEACLNVISNLNEESNNITQDIVLLLKTIFVHLTSNDQTIRSLAYNAYNFLIRSSDNDLFEFFNPIWELHLKGSVDEMVMPSYIKIISSLIKLTEELDDKTIDELLNWLDELFSSDDSSIQVAALLIVGALLDKDETIADSFSEQTIKILNNELQSDDEFIVHDCLEFLNEFIITQKDNSISFIKQFSSFLIELLGSSNTSINCDAMKILSIYTGYSKDLSFLQNLCEIIIKYVNDFNDYYRQSDGCFSARFIAKVLGNSQYSLELFESILKIIYLESEDDLINDALLALKALYKYSYKFNQEFFDSKSIAFLNDLFEGKIKYLNDTPPHRLPKFSNIIESTMEFIGYVFKYKHPSVNSICEYLLQLLQVREEYDVFSIIGALCDAVEYCNIDQNIIMNICQFIAQYSSSVKNIDLQQNIAYFMSLILIKFPQYVEFGTQMLPTLINWFNDAKKKETGTQELLSNIASFFLHFSCIQPELNECYAIEALKLFPPFEIGESKSQCDAIIELSSKKISSSMQLYIAIGISKLITETSSKRNNRKIEPETYKSLCIILKQLLEIQEIQERIEQLYMKNKSKKRAIINAINSL